MIELEDRLRATLTELADTVPPSTHPRAELQRRLSRRRRVTRATRASRPLLAAAAAAVVVAGVAVPAVLNRDTGGQSSEQAGGPTTPATNTLRNPNPQLNDPYNSTTIEATAIAKFTVRGEEWLATVMAVRTPIKGGGWRNEVCVNASRTGTPGVAPKTEQHPNSSCVDVPKTWPAGPTNSLVISRGVLEGPTGGPLPNWLVFMTAPQVTTLEVREGDGSPAAVHEAGHEAGFRIYVAEFRESHQGFGYTAKNGAGTILEQAIT